jgi:peptide/nickel transport system substrate-binding protein
MLGSLLLNPAFAVPPINRPMEIYVATIEGASPDTVDPAWSYDTASGELLFNVYETLIAFDGEHADMYLPQLATDWILENITGTTSPEGLPWYFRYTFKIRTGVPFHCGPPYILTPADVEYSIERGMVQDRDGGPQWMFYEPLLDSWGAQAWDIGNSTVPGPEAALVGKMIDHAVESNATHVWFNLAFPGAYRPFLQILCQEWAGVLSKQWINDYVTATLGRPDWNGEWDNRTAWIQYNAPEISPLDDPTPIMCGTGPFSLVILDYGEMYWQIDRNTAYWRGWPADWPAPPYPSDPVKHVTPAGYVDTAKVTWAFDWATRSAMFLAGDVDFCAVPKEDIGQIIGQPGIRCFYALSALQVYNLFYTFNISLGSPYGPINPPGEFSEDAIPSDFFGNSTWGIHTRKAFSYAFDYDAYVGSAFLGEATHPATAIIPGLPCHDPTVEGYEYDLAKAEAEFKAVPGLWDTGFTISLVYNEGNLMHFWACFYLNKSIVSLNNPKFHVKLIKIYPYYDYYLAMVKQWLPTFSIAWLADYPDPHNFAVPFYHSKGAFAEWQGYNNSIMDAWIEGCIRESDPDEKCAIYHDIQQLAVDDCPSVPISQPIRRHFERDWTVGWYYNIIYPGLYFYPLWKWYYCPHSTYAECPPYPVCNHLPYDVNYDGTVDMKDIGICCKAYGSTYGPPQHPRWHFRCDVDNDRKIDMKDIGYVAKYYGCTSATWSPP